MLRLALVAMLAIACSGSGSDRTAANPGDTTAQAASGESRDACSLITREEANSIIGSAVTPQARSMSATHSVCDYVPVSGGATPAYQGFTLEAYWTGGEELIEVGRRAAGTATDAAGGKEDDVVASVMGLRTVQGVGDEAYFSPRTMSYVRKGDKALEFQLGGLTNPTQEHFEKLARAALSRL